MSVLHPVHFQSNNKTFPSAFIPYCEFGGNMSRMGLQLEDPSHVPLCNIFQAKILNDQLCYEVDLNTFSNQDSKEHELQSGFAFIMDYNEDRQVTFDLDRKEVEKTDLVSRIAKSDDNKHAFVYLNTIGMYVEIKSVT